MFSVHQATTMACLLDVSVPKPGNVHRGADFADMTFLDFAASAVAIGPVMAKADQLSVGETILKSIQATRVVTDANTNLGIVLLLAPLARVACERTATDRRIESVDIAVVLSRTSPQDAAAVFEAIRAAKPGGLGKVPKMDIHGDEVPNDLMAAMRLAADRDLVAKQYATAFVDVFQLRDEIVLFAAEFGLMQGIISAYLNLIGREPDSLIKRKCGIHVAKEASAKARRITEMGKPGSTEYDLALREFDFWLRSDGNRRNPGTSADLITAALFLALFAETLSLR